MASSVVRSNSGGFFHVGTPYSYLQYHWCPMIFRVNEGLWIEGAHLCSPCEVCLRSGDKGRCQHVDACSGECMRCTAVCLEMDGGRFEHLLSRRGI
jgi:hypothetical protein